MNGKTILIKTLLVFLIVSIIPVDASVSYSSHMMGPLQNDCTLCHSNNAGGGDRNSFGKEFETNGHVVNDFLLSKDTDRDGYENGVELEAGTYPADRTSHPGSEVAMAYVEKLKSAQSSNSNESEVAAEPEPELIAQDVVTEDDATDEPETAPAKSTSPVVIAIVVILLVAGIAMILFKK